MVQVTEEEWAEIQKRLNLPARKRLTAAEIEARFRAAEKVGPKPMQMFRHRGTGDFYTVAGVALNEATLEPVVVYRGCADFGGDGGPVFTRPLVAFAEKFVDASGPGRGDPGQYGVNPAADAMAAPSPDRQESQKQWRD